MGLFDRARERDEAGLYALLQGADETAAVHASRRLEKLHASLAENRDPTESQQLRKEIVALEHKLLSLGLFTRTLMRLLVEKGVVTQAELEKRIEELDMEDGVRDGR